MGLLSVIATPDERKRIIYIEKDIEGKKNARRKKKSADGGSEDNLKGIHPQMPWGGS
jgi:hypothetical protein